MLILWLNYWPCRDLDLTLLLPLDQSLHEALVAVARREEAGALGDEPPAFHELQHVDVLAPRGQVVARPIAPAEVQAREVGRGVGSRAVGLDVDHLRGQGVLGGDVLEPVVFCGFIS